MVITADGPIGVPADCTYLFAGYANVRTVDFGDTFVAHDVENMRAMFYGCSSLASLEVSAFDTSKLTNMEWIVCTCTSLKSLDLTKWDVGAVKESEGMFNGLTKSTETQRLREEVCTLIRHHMLPTRLLERSEPDRLAREVASVGELVPGFTWRELCLLSEADLRERIADDVDERVELIDLCRLFAEEMGCLEGPFEFADTHTRRAYLMGRNVPLEHALFDDAWGEVTLVCGLPDTGKDTWVRQYLPGVPVVSLDDVRCEMGVRSRDDQGKVVQEAMERARVCLRDRRRFVWNATNLTVRTRSRIVGLCEGYGARVRIVYLGAQRDVTFGRNSARSGDERVPIGVMEHMLSRLEPPLPGKADAVEWLCV